MPFDATPWPRITRPAQNTDLEILRTIRDKVAQGLWCKHAASSGEARCIMGWLVALAPLHATAIASQCLESTIPRWNRAWFTDDSTVGAIIGYNDRVLTQQHHVMKWLDRAIQRAEEVQ
jgi:hypothetical protein